MTGAQHSEFNVTYHGYHRTVIGYHGTSRNIAESLVAGEPFQPSMNDDDWFGNGVYFWEYAPQQAWWWARELKKKEEPAVVGAMIRLGNCFDLLDPVNIEILKGCHRRLIAGWPKDSPTPINKRQAKRLDCGDILSIFQY